MLRLVGPIRKISLIGLMAAVLAPFAFRPLLSMGMHDQGFSPEVSYSNNGMGRHLARSLIHQLDSQVREADLSFQNPSLVHSKYIRSRVRVDGSDVKQRPLFLVDGLSPFPPGHAIPLRI